MANTPRISLLVVLVGFLVGQMEVSSGEVKVREEWQKPSFCRDRKCPKYTVIQTTQDYEVRRYAPAKWINTSSESGDVMEMFRKLKTCMDENSIPMTGPVLTAIESGNAYCMYFFIPDDVGNPEISDTTVDLTLFGELTFYVRSFGCFADDTKCMDNLEDLKKRLPDTAYGLWGFLCAAYDRPDELENRHNEVWLEKIV